MSEAISSPRNVLPEGIEVLGAVRPEWERVLTPDALAFIARLQREFGTRRLELLENRKNVLAELRAGRSFEFLPETAEIRDSEWTVAPIPDDLQDRRVEITGPVDRKMIINALNSGASCFMADFEDATTPTWANLIDGQLNLIDAVAGTIELESGGKHYHLHKDTATLIVRPRGWHLPEKHILVDGQPMSGSLFDFGLYSFHNAARLLARGSGPYFYLPKLEHHLEARLWNDVFVFAQNDLGIPTGKIRATVLIETIPAAFQMDEILWELRDHSAGLNCGRWDYIFSVIKKFSHDPNAIFPDRGLVTMTTHFLRSYSLLTIRTCHRRGVHAMGGMAAQIPVKNDDAANEAAMEKVRADKLREATNGHDGTWVAHPGLIPIAKEIFDREMPDANQIAKMREDVDVSSADLVRIPDGAITEAGVRQNINVGILYLAAWLDGLGCVPLYNLMEDAATAEISRAQLWQWTHHGATLDDGRRMTPELYRSIRSEELQAIRERVGDTMWESGHYQEAAELFDELTLADDIADFLTLPAYERILTIDERRTGR